MRYTKYFTNLPFMHLVKKTTLNGVVPLTWKRFPPCSPLVHWIHKSPAVSPHRGPVMRSFDPWWRHEMETHSALLAICAGNSQHKGQWRRALMFSLICVWIKGWVNNREAGDLRRHRSHYDVIVMQCFVCCHFVQANSRVAAGLARHGAIVTLLLHRESGQNVEKVRYVWFCCWFLSLANVA